ncbi:xanthine dehydrogenase family protein subunit M [Marimonas sp. MJW-29]|uniref:Xanthine dehydrogenase family protein subunit M n=1 Tax=Sulfitobacter sediminis TaxID=3234186 RepID=A0ABV3RJP7_9RHOB
MHYLRPETLDQALAALAEARPRIAAGCTDLFPMTPTRGLPGPVLDITGIAGLRGIARTPDGLRIGAATTWTDILRADLPPALRGLQLAAREVGARQIQNRGTLAGNLCNASPAADGVPPLLTLDAQVELQSVAGSRSLPLAQFITGPRQTALQSGEMVTAIHLPEAALRGQSHFLKLGARAYLVISIAMCAVRIEVGDGVVTDAALSIGACGPLALRLGAVEAALVGHPLDPSRVTDAAVAAALSPIDDVRADARYRSEAAAEVLRRTLAAMAAEEVA